MPAEPTGPVLLERRTDDGADVHADRVTDAGEVWRWTTVHATIDDGELRFTHGPGAWERLGELDPAALADLRALITGTDAADLPEEVEPEGAVLGGVEETWTIAGRAVVVHGAPVAGTPALETLAEALDAAVGAAGD